MFLYPLKFARFRAKYWKNVLQWPLHLHILFYLFRTFRLYEVRIVKHIGDKESILTCSYTLVHLPYLVVYSKKKIKMVWSDSKFQNLLNLYWTSFLLNFMTLGLLLWPWSSKRQLTLSPVGLIIICSYHPQLFLKMINK